MRNESKVIAASEWAATDKELWVNSTFGRCRLDGNAHTFPGRISAWSATLGEWVTLSRSDVHEAPAEVWAWIDGFLAGNEPEIHEFLGVESAEAIDFDRDDEESERYQGAMATFRETGAFPFSLDPMPRTPPPQPLSADPWVLVGGRVLRWDGTSWSPQDPQPRVRYSLLVGTICDERGHCRLDEGDQSFSACADCGHLTELATD